MPIMELEEKVQRKLALLNQKAGMRHRNYCTYNPNIWGGPTSEYCTCDLHERKAVIDEALAKLDG